MANDVLSVVYDPEFIGFYANHIIKLAERQISISLIWSLQLHGHSLALTSYSQSTSHLFARNTSLFLLAFPGPLNDSHKRVVSAY